jgi:cytidylate kinase
MTRLIIAIDGPSGAGKSSLGKALAKHLELQYIDSGAVYRAIGCTAVDRGVSLEDRAAVSGLARKIEITLEGEPDQLRIAVDGKDVTRRVRQADASEAASVVATIPEVREAVVEKLRGMSRRRGVVMDGRDIGTKVFPEATVKLFLEASSSRRAGRRWEEEREQGRDVSLDTVQSELDERDRRDRERAATPLVMAPDAILINTSDIPLDRVISRALEIVEARR